MTGEARMMHSCSLYLLLIMPMLTSNFPKTSSDLKLNMWHFKRKELFLPQADRWVGEAEGILWTVKNRQCLATSSLDLVQEAIRLQYISGILCQYKLFIDHNPKVHQGGPIFCKYVSASNAKVTLEKWCFTLEVRWWTTVWMLNLFQYQTLKGVC